MRFFSNLLGMLAFRRKSLRLQAESRLVFTGIVFYSSGFLAYALVRNHVYAVLSELAEPASESVYIFWQLNLIQTLLFLLTVFMPILALLGNSIKGEMPGFVLSGRDYVLHVSALLPLWGLLFFLTAPVQWLAPHFLSIGILDISIGMLTRSVLLAVYTVWAVKRLNFLTTVQTLGVFVLSCLTIPFLFIMTYTWYADVLLILAVLVFLCFRWVRKRRVKKGEKPEVLV
jgi:hypothetical protein